MNKFFAQLSIKWKIITIIIAICSFVIISGLLLFISNEITDTKRDQVNSAQLYAKLIGEYCTTSLYFGYPDKVEESLQKTIVVPQIINIIIYDENNNTFAATKEKIPFQNLIFNSSESKFQFSGNYLNIIEPIMYEGKKYGSIYLQLNTGIADQLRQTIIFIFLAGFGLLILSYFLSNKFQNLISQPILKLADVAQKISKSHNYAIRIRRNSNDEVGILYDEFNEMLKVIQQRDAELKISEKRFRNIFNSQHDAIFIHDINGKIIDINDTMLKMYNVSREKAFDLSITEDYSSSENLLDDLSKRWSKVIRGEIQEFEWKAKRPIDGSTFDVQVNLQKITHGDNENILATIRNITDRKKAEQELNQAQNYIENIINSMPSIIIGIDKNGKITQWNKFTEKNTGIKSPDAKGKDLFTIFPELKLNLSKIQESIKTRKTLTNSKIKRKVKDDIKIEDITIYPLIANGEEGAVIRVDDVTDQVRMEEMMIQTEKMMSVGGLAAGMAHEINNPLAGIIQNIQVAKNRLSIKNPKNISIAQECGLSMDILIKYLNKRSILTMLELVQYSGIRASKIVHNMLSFSQKSRNIMTKNNITEIIDQTIELCSNDYDLNNKFDFKKIKIKKIYQENLPSILCEFTKIQQVLLNILKNAAHAIHSKNEKLTQTNEKNIIPQLFIRIKEIENFVQIEIEDNGPGIPANITNRIFEPFFTTKKVGNGTGLGLSVSYFIITDDHNGKMNVVSEEGRGTNFIIKLPK